MPTPNKHKMTAEEFFKFTPENETERYELINGEIVAQAAPNIQHQSISMGLSVEIGSFIKANKGGCKPFAAPTDVQLDNENVVEPDFFILCDPSKLDKNRCYGAPDFVIEIASSNRSADFTRKLSLYKEFGVREYWIIDPASEKVLVYLFEKSLNTVNIYSFTDLIPVGIYDGKLSINISEMI